MKQDKQGQRPWFGEKCEPFGGRCYHCNDYDPNAQPFSSSGTGEMTRYLCQSCNNLRLRQLQRRRQRGGV
ncbi:hypothetical protein [Dictyobacter arantiisoli]|uniref:Uncharacterized protein n=1 Tax=Dictyobacter arantiisoli TaxID=2014874 RepID=A0A5A5TH45_9CHLR|nr:hypothetical protein [Dictyobacter arantiisoli]GCF10891.1 hypothetical protein KDI_44550 [Dictyobacter arantiisoli]